MKNLIQIKIPAGGGISYPIHLNTSLFNIDKWLLKKKFSRIIIITDANVKKRYGSLLHQTLEEAGYSSLLLSFPAGEKYKNHDTKQKIETALLKNRCDRQSLIIALGGGIVGDLAGFIAATYQRGIPFISIPTTLLAMVDSSVGGKTGMNTPQGKNLIGLIYQPIRVVSDLSVLNTLSPKQKINGLVEAIKICITQDAKRFHYIEKNKERILSNNPTVMKNIIAHAIHLKAGVVMRDEKEQGERHVLNFGHTIGHALEAVSHFTLLHGWAVGYGILVEAKISQLAGILDDDSFVSIKTLLGYFGILGRHLKKYTISSILKATRNDKKARAGEVHYVLLRSLGHVHRHKKNYTHPIAHHIVKTAILMIMNEE